MGLLPQHVIDCRVLQGCCCDLVAFGLACGVFQPGTMTSIVQHVELPDGERNDLVNYLKSL